MRPASGSAPASDAPLLRPEEFSRRVDEVYGSGFRRAWPPFLLALPLLVAGIAAEQGFVSRLRPWLGVLTAAFFASVLGGCVVFVVAGERTARRMGLRCRACDTPLYGGPARNVAVLDTGRCARCGARALYLD